MATKPMVITGADVEHAAQVLAGGGSRGELAKAIGVNRCNNTLVARVVDDPRVQKRAQELIRTKFERKNITGDRVMTELARLAFASAKDMFDPKTGEMLSIHDMDDDTAATVVGFDVEERVEGRGDSATTFKVKKVRRGDKLGALTILAKHFKLVNDNDGVNALAGALADRLNAAKKRITPLEDPEDARIIEPRALEEGAHPSIPSREHELQPWAEEAEQPPTLPVANQASQASPALDGDDDEETLW